VGELFGRHARVTIGAPGEGALVIDSGDPPKRGFRIAFACEKSLKSSLNSATVRAWNLSEASRFRIQRDRTRFLLEAGYQRDLFGVFKGQATRSWTAREGADLVTTIDSLDGYDAVQDSEVAKVDPRAGQRVAVKFPAGTRIDALIEAVAAFLTLGGDVRLGDLDAAFAEIELEAAERGLPFALVRSLTLEHKAGDVLDRLGRMYRFDWSIQDGVLELHPWDRIWRGDVVEVTPATGLIGTPTPIWQATREGGETGTVIGARFTSLLRASIRPGALVSLASEAVSGTFRVHSTRYEGDTISGPFSVDAECYNLPGVVE